MKLRFCISYRAAFGQALHVVIRYIDVDGRMRDFNLPMYTDDGDVWMAESSGVVVSAHAARMRYLLYHYQVEDGDGKVLRKEWDAVPRLYLFEAPKTYLFQDIWRDLSIRHYIYYAKQQRPVTQLTYIPLFNRSVFFRVSAPHVKEGQSVALLGSDAALGVWNEKRYLKMYYVGDGDWMLSINAMAMVFPFEYKYVVIDDKSHDVVEWENGGNRVANVERLEDGEQLVLYGGNVRTACVLEFHDELLGKLHRLRNEIRDLYI